MALTASVARKDTEVSIIEYPVKAGELIFAGAIVALQAGYAVKGKTALNLRVKGIAKTYADNSTGSDGGKTVAVELCHCVKGLRLFALANDTGSGNVLTQADVGSDVYLKDDTTVSKSSASNTRSLAGELMGFNEDGLPLVCFNK